MATSQRRCVFVGNIPYDATEEQLIRICEEVGPVVSFRLVTDRETGKPKGYGFCEYKDEETALSARRNLQGCEINGRQLRVDFAENDKNAEKSREQGHGGPGMTANIGDAQKQVGGQAVRPGSNFHQPVGLPVAVAAANVMAGALGSGQIAVKLTQIGLETQTGIGTDPLTMHLSKMSRNQLTDILSELKVLATENKEQARQLLLAFPLLPKAIFQAQVMLGVVTPQMLQMPNIRQAFFPSGHSLQSVNQTLSSLPLLAQNKMHFESTLKSQEGEVPVGQPNILVQNSYTPPSQPQVQLPILSQNQYQQQVPTPVLPGVSTVLPTPSQNIVNMSIRPQTQAITSPYVKQQVQPSLFQNRGQAAPANLGNNSQLVLPHGNLEPSVLSSSLNVVNGPKYANTAYDRPPQLVNNSDRDTYKRLPQGSLEKATMTHDNQNTVNHPSKLIKLNDGRSSSSSADVNVSTSVSGSFQAPGMYMNHPKAEEASTTANQTSQLAPEVESVLLQQVLSLTPEQLSSLPPEQQQQVFQLQQMLRLS